MKNGIPHIKYYQLLEWKDDNMDKFYRDVWRKTIT